MGEGDPIFFSVRVFEDGGPGVGAALKTFSFAASGSLNGVASLPIYEAMRVSA